jgi:hypothetical protein
VAQATSNTNCGALIVAEAQIKQSSGVATYLTAGLPA